MKTSHHKTYVWIIFTTLGTCAVLLLLILPSVRRIQELNHEMTRRKVILEQLYEQGQSTKKIANNIEQIQEFIPLLNRAFLYRGEELAFITTMETSATSRSLVHTLTFSDVSKKDARGERGTVEVPISITVGGQYRNIVQFLSDLDRMPFYVNVKSISIGGNAPINQHQISGARSAPTTVSTSDDSGGQVYAGIEAVTYWREKEAVTSKVENP